MSGLGLSQSEPVARKPHTCWLCSRTIEPGEKYLRAAWIDDDAGFMSFAQCAHCQALVRIFGDEFIYDWHEGYSPDEVREWEPESPEGVEAKRHFLHGWRTAFGALYEVPARVVSRPGQETGR